MTDYKNLKVFEKSQVNGLTKHLSALRFKTAWDDRTNDVMIKRANELGLELDYYRDSEAEKFVFKVPRKITAEQTKFGKAWLKEYFFKKDGTPRSGKRTEYVGDRVLRIAKNASRFEFVGVYGLTNSFGSIVQFVPIYRTYNRKGEYFDYAPIHWGSPIIEEGV
jgi:hypothetical protein